MSTAINVALWGLGNMNPVVARYLLEKGDKLFKIVAVIDRNPSRVGKDAGEYLGMDSLKGIVITDPKDAENVLKQSKAQACVIATRSTMQDNYSQYETCAKAGVNAISLGEETIYPYQTSKDLTEKLDKLAKEHSVTLSGTGYQDVYWAHLIAVVAGSVHRIDRIEGCSQYNVDDYGRALCEAHGVGLSVKEFQDTIDVPDAAPSYMWNSNQYLCSIMGWKIKSHTQKLLPTHHEQNKPIFSKTLKAELPTGSAVATGMKAVVTTVTEEGIEIVSSCIGKVYDGVNDVDANEWKLIGEPAVTEVKVARPATVELTCATAVNRLVQLVNAEPGYVSTEKMGYPKYLNKSQ